MGIFTHVNRNYGITHYWDYEITSILKLRLQDSPRLRGPYTVNICLSKLIKTLNLTRMSKVDQCN